MKKALANRTAFLYRSSAVTRSTMLAAAILLSTVAFPASASDWWDWSPTFGSTTINVHTMGALGDGKADDTAAFQRAVDSLPADGGTVYVPPGTYRLNPLRSACPGSLPGAAHICGVNLRSHMKLAIDPLAQLVTITNGEPRYNLISAWNVTNVLITGGSLVGDRVTHTPSPLPSKDPTGKDEFGYGINISGSDHVFVSNLQVSKFWGDGLAVGARGKDDTLNRSGYVTLYHVTSSQNRRQALTITVAHHVYVANSTFKDTGGTAPEAGVDIEPQTQGTADTLRFYNNTISGNAKNGMVMSVGTSGITILNNTIADNGAYGIYAANTANLRVLANNVTRNFYTGVILSGTTHDSTVGDNSLTYNSTKFFCATCTGGEVTRDLQKGSNTYNNTFYNNTTTPQ